MNSVKNASPLIVLLVVFLILLGRYFQLRGKLLGKGVSLGNVESDIDCMLLALDMQKCTYIGNNVSDQWEKYSLIRIKDIFEIKHNRSIIDVAMDRDKILNSIDLFFSIFKVLPFALVIAFLLALLLLIFKDTANPGGLSLVPIIAGALGFIAQEYIYCYYLSRYTDITHLKTIYLK